MNKLKEYCGYIGIIGKENVGKSTILNQIIGEKISITSSKPGTTQNNIIGIATKKNYQLIYIDTPGIKLNKKNNNSKKIENNLEIIMLVVNKTKWSHVDDVILKNAIKKMKPIILIINKIDLIKDKKILLPYINFLRKKHNFIEIIPISAKNENNIKILLEVVKKHIPPSSHYFPKNYITNSSYSFIISEIIREKIIRSVGQEIPYNIQVKIESCKKNTHGKYFIKALILVKNTRHKKIIIGKKGEKIKSFGTLARKEIEKKIHKSIYLNLWIKKIRNKIWQ